MDWPRNVSGSLELTAVGLKRADSNQGEEKNGWIAKNDISLIRSDTNLELDHLSLSLLVTTQLKMLASFQWNLFSELAFTALHSQHNLLCSLCFLVMNGSSLTTKTWLFPFVTSLSFGKSSLLCSFVLCHLVKGVFTAFGSFAKRFSCFWNVHHFDGGQWLLSLRKWKIEDRMVRNLPTCSFHTLQSFCLKEHEAPTPPKVWPPFQNQINVAPYLITPQKVPNKTGPPTKT